MTEQKKRTGQKQYPKERAYGFYLGNKEHKERRLANLAAVSEILGLRGAASVVSGIADIPPAELAAAVGPLIEKYKGVAGGDTDETK